MDGTRTCVLKRFYGSPPALQALTGHTNHETSSCHAGACSLRTGLNISVHAASGSNRRVLCQEQPPRSMQLLRVA